jgi:hypothetical protein
MTEFTKAKDLTDSEQYQFTSVFYSQWEFPKDDLFENMPLGCPWLFGLDIFLEGDTIDEMARNWYSECRSDIIAEFKPDYDFDCLEDQFNYLMREG